MIYESALFTKVDFKFCVCLVGVVFLEVDILGFNEMVYIFYEPAYKLTIHHYK